jgi:muramoyltetrapeptide carboxypeptidase
MTQKTTLALAAKAPALEPIYVISPSGAVPSDGRLELAAAHLKQAGYRLKFDRAVRSQYQRFAGRDEVRAASFDRAAEQSASIVMISRGGYGLTRYLDRLNYPVLARADKKWVGFSDFTAFQLAMLAKAGAVTWAGATVLDSFGKDKFDDIDANTLDAFSEAMDGSLEILGFTCQGPKEVDVRGVLWGGNLRMICSLLGTEYFPKIKNGILFVEDVNEHPYRTERNLTQLLHAGVLDAQKAIVFGYFNGYRLSDVDRGFDMPAVIKRLRNQTKTPILTGLPFGHTIADDQGRYTTRLTLPHGARVGLATEGRTCYLVLPHGH